MRVHELAKKLDVSSKELITRLESMGVEVKTHMSAVSESDVALVLEGKAPVAAGTTPAPAEPEPVAPPAEEAPAGPDTDTAVAAPVETQVEPTLETAVAATKPEALEPAETEEDAEEDPDDKNIVVKGPVVVREFAEMIGMKPNQVIAELMSMNVFASINEKVEIKIAQQLATKHGYTLEQEKRQPDRKPAPPVKKEEQKETNSCHFISPL